jgi:hypothetical protein
MTITELINYFRNNGNKDEFFENNSLDPESEVIEIYMREPLGIENEIKLFEIEKTEGNLTYIHENIEYQNIIKHCCQQCITAITADSTTSESTRNC